jgi:tetratricopeptide (TPR) repeat protein
MQGSSVGTFASYGDSGDIAGRVMSFVRGIGFVAFVSLLVVEAVMPDVALSQHIRLARVPDYGRVYTQIGRTALNKGQYVRALRVLHEAIQRGAPADAYKLRARAYYKLQKQEKATADLNRYIGMQPKDPSGYLVRGEWRITKGEPRAALKDFERALQLGPPSSDGLIGRGIAFLALEEYDKAILDFRKALTLEPNITDALINLGVACRLSRRDLCAVNAFRKALESTTNPEWRKKLQVWLDELENRPKRDIRPMSQED